MLVRAFHRQRAAFTLIELLASMAVLTLLVVTVVQIVNSTTSVTSNSRHQMDADSQARAVFDCLAADFAAMPLRADVDYIFTKSTGNDGMFFYSETPAYFATGPDASLRSPVALVGYRVTSAYQLERLGKGLTWGGTPNGEQGGAAVFLTFPTVPPSPSPTPSATPTPLPQSTLAGNWPSIIGTAGQNFHDGTSDDYHVLSSTVFRLEYCFLLNNGTVSNLPHKLSTSNPQGLHDVSAIIVAIAVLDDTSRQIVPSLDTMAGLLTDFNGPESPANSTSLMATTWQNVLNSPTFAAQAAVPASAAAAVHVYQRYFYLNNQ